MVTCRLMKWLPRVLFAGVLFGGAASAQSAWRFNLEWEHDGTGVTHFRLCVDGTCQNIAPERPQGDTWRYALPLLPPGEHRLVVQACNEVGCSNGQPDIWVRVFRSSPAPPRHPPVQVPSNKPKLPTP